MRFRFGGFLLDDESFRLTRGGRAVPLRRKVFDLLVVLVRERERVVLREELVERLWSTTTVGAGSLSGLVNELRAALGELGRGPSSIRTVHARGYQFAATVEVESPQEVATRPSPIASPGDRAEGERAGSDRFRRARVEVARAGARALVIASPEPAVRARWLAAVMAEAVEVGFQARWQVVSERGEAGEGRVIAPPALPAAAGADLSTTAGRVPIALGLDVREPEAWARIGGLPRLLDLLGRAPVLVIAAMAAPEDDAIVRGLVGSDARIECAAPSRAGDATGGWTGSTFAARPTQGALAGILRALARADASEFESALRSMGFESARLGPIRAARRVEPLARIAEGRRGTDGI